MKEKILEILNDTRPEFDFTEDGVNFIENGYLDSFDVITLVADLEAAFGIKINGASIVPENFKNLTSIENLVENSK